MTDRDDALRFGQQTFPLAVGVRPFRPLARRAPAPDVTEEPGMKKPPKNSGRIPGAFGAPDPLFINTDAPLGPGPEPSLAMRVARATMNDAFQTDAPPFDGDTRREETTQPTTTKRSGPIESRSASWAAALML
jgi:hypothetical protein